MSDWHVLPVADVVEHEETRQCPCLPFVEETSGEAVVTHNAWDGRA